MNKEMLKECLKNEKHSDRDVLISCLGLIDEKKKNRT